MLAREPKMVNREFDYYFSQSKLKKSLAGDFDDVPESSVTVFSDFRGGKSRARLSGVVARLLLSLTKNRIGAVYNVCGKSNINETMIISASITSASTGTSKLSQKLLKIATFAPSSIPSLADGVARRPVTTRVNAKKTLPIDMAYRVVVLFVLH